MYTPVNVVQIKYRCDRFGLGVIQNSGALIILRRRAGWWMVWPWRGTKRRWWGDRILVDDRRSVVVRYGARTVGKSRMAHVVLMDHENGHRCELGGNLEAERSGIASGSSPTAPPPPMLLLSTVLDISICCLCHLEARAPRRSATIAGFTASILLNVQRAAKIVIAVLPTTMTQERILAALVSFFCCA